MRWRNDLGHKERVNGDEEIHGSSTTLSYGTMEQASGHWGQELVSEAQQCKQNVGKVFTSVGLSMCVLFSDPHQ